MDKYLDFAKEQKKKKKQKKKKNPVKQEEDGNRNCNSCANNGSRRPGSLV